MNEQSNENAAQAVSRSRIARGIRLFVALTVIGMALILYRSSFKASLLNLRDFSLVHLALIAGLVLFDWCVGSLRIHIFASRVHPHFPYRSCLKANLANIFMGGVTPSQTGGGAGQIYALYKEGMSGIDAAVASFLGFISTAAFLPVCGILLNIFLESKPESVTLQALSLTTIVLFSFILLLVILSLISPVRFEQGVRGMLKLLPFLRRPLERSRALQKFLETFRRYHTLMVYFLKKGKLVLAAGFVLTVLVYSGKFVIAYFVIEGLGVDVDFWQVVYLQLLIYLIFYFTPTPGASGMAEVSSALIMGQLLPKSHVGTFVLLWRFFTLFVGMAAGAVILLRYLLGSDRGRRDWNAEDLDLPAPALGKTSDS